MRWDLVRNPRFGKYSPNAYALKTLSGKPRIIFVEDSYASERRPGSTRLSAPPRISPMEHQTRKRYGRVEVFTSSRCGVNDSGCNTESLDIGGIIQSYVTVSEHGVSYRTKDKHCDEADADQLSKIFVDIEIRGSCSFFKLSSHHRSQTSIMCILGTAALKSKQETDER